MYTSANIKTSVINNIMLQMAAYIKKAELDILQRVLEEQFVFLNVEQITTLPAEADTTTEEKNRYLIGLFKIKKRNLTPKTMEQYLRAVNSLITVIDKPVTDMDEIDIDYYLRWYERRNVCNNGARNQASTCNNERRYLSAFFTWLRKERFVPGNPVEAVEPLKETRKPIDYFRPAQLEELREGCRTAKVILWTCREGEYLKSAIKYCRKHGLEFDAINDNIRENIEYWKNNSRKVFANYYIDDKNLFFENLGVKE